MNTFTLPEGSAARPFLLPPALAEGFPFAVIVAPSKEQATVSAFLEGLVVPGGFAALLTHDDGVGWPDAAGERLLVGTIERGGIAMLGFKSRADAEAGFRRAWRAIAPWTGQNVQPEWEGGAHGPPGGRA